MADSIILVMVTPPIELQGSGFIHWCGVWARLAGDLNGLLTRKKLED